MATRTAVLALAACTTVIAGCSDSSTSPQQCDGHTTTASFTSSDSLTGVVTSIRFRGTTEIVVFSVSGSTNLLVNFSVADTTPVFERTGAASPQPTSACALAVGRQIEIPYAYFANGFGDYIPVTGGNDPAPPIPPVIDQVVVVH